MDGYVQAVKCMGIQPGESVLVLTDSKMDPIIPEGLVKASERAGAKALLLSIEPTGRHGAEPPEWVAEKMKEFDVIFMPTTYSLSHTKAREKASETGARIASMPGITRDIMESGAMTADYEIVSRLVEIASRFLEGKKVHITSPSGTDVEFEIIGPPLKDTGIFDRPGSFGNLPAGEAFVPIEKGEGKIVFDMFSGETGVEIDVSGNRGSSPILEKEAEGAGKKALELGEFGIGANPRARVTGNILEDEKAFHTVHLAFGNNVHFGGKNDAPFHEDGIIIQPTVEIDGKIVMNKGEWVF